MRAEVDPLDFQAVDGLAFAASRGLLANSPQPLYASDTLGPLFELRQLSESGLLPPPGKLLSLDGYSSMISALDRRIDLWLAPPDERMGFIRALRSPGGGDESMTRFLMASKRAARNVALFPEGVSGQLVAAMRELENNIHEHSHRPDTGVVAFSARAGVFEFAVTDLGIGVLSSLRTCASYAHLQTEGAALEAALSEGVSRHGEGTGHGFGFRPIFTGLAHLQGELRFRSGDYALSILGSGATPTRRTSEKARLKGFLISVGCRLNQLSTRTAV